jgi:hypothetical protein
VRVERRGKVGLSSRAVGEVVCDCLRQAGLDYEWNGDEACRIEVKGLTPAV